MKKILLLLLSLLLLLPLTACGSAFEHPEDYVTLPDLKSITVSGKEIEEELNEVIKDLLDSLEGEHFTPLVSSSETVKLGDRVHVSFTPEANNTISQETLTLLKAEEADRIYVIPGSETMPKALEDIVMGTKVGDSLSTNITYTKDDTDLEDLIGKTITLNIKVHGIARLTVSERHAVRLTYTAKLANDEAPLDTILSLLKGGVETVDLADDEDTFAEVFPSEALIPHLVGLHKLEKKEFTLTLPKEKAEEFGYDKELSIVITATVTSATEKPTALSDLLIDEMTYGAYTTTEAYLTFCRNMVKEELALQAIMAKAVFTDDLPEDEYEEFYTENYNAALYATVGDVSGYTPEQLSAMLSTEVLQKIEETAHENTVSELKERLVLEYLYDLLNVTLSEEEYQEKLDELFKSYYNEYYYMLYYYGIDTAEKLEDYLGKDYIEVQFLYEKLLPLLKDVITYQN